MLSQKSNKRKWLWLLLALLFLATIVWFSQRNQEDSILPETTTEEGNKKPAQVALSIEELTNEDRVVAYLMDNNSLPPYYVTKATARKNGWLPEKGNLCKVLPGKAIGGDVFGNRENRLPASAGEVYYEADINYSCGTRNADRIIFSKSGRIFITKDHYKTFQRQ